jgi:hypothetical protein
MNHNPWKTMSLEDARAYDERKETGPLRHRALAESTGWEVLSMYPSDLLISLVEKDLMDKLLLSSGEQMIKEWVSLEEQIRGDQDLLGCGPDVQFVLGKPVRERV